MHFWWRPKPGEDDDRINITDKSLYPEFRRKGIYYIKNAVIMTLLIWLLLSVFYGTMHKRTYLGKNITLELIDLDHGPVGANLTRLLQQIPNSEHSPQWTIYDKVSTPEETKEYVRKYSWGALMINPGLSDRLFTALYNDADYDPTDALTIIRSTGRHPTGELLFAATSLSTDTAYLISTYSRQIVEEFKQATRDSPESMNGTNIEAVLSPIKYTDIDVGPMNFPCAVIWPTFTSLVILLCTLSAIIEWKMSSFAFFLKVRYRDLLLFWLAVMFSWVAVISLYAPLSFLAYKGPTYVSNHEGRPVTAGMFFSLWATVATVALASGLWLLSIAFLVPPMYIPALFPPTIVFNVCSSIAPAELAPTFFRWFNALPLYNGAMLMRHIISGAYPRLQQQLPVLLGEVFLMAVGLSVSIWIRQYWVINGISDIPGWFRGYVFFKSPVPYYKDVAAAQEDGNGARDDTESDKQDPCRRQEDLPRTESSGELTSSDLSIIDMHNHVEQADMRGAMFGV